MLLAHLPRYVRHLQQYPHSLLARLLGTTEGQILDCTVPGEGGSWGGAQESLALFQAGLGLHLGAGDTD